MAKKTTVSLEDDIEGGPAAETLSFSLGGTSYEIDLSKRNAAKLRKTLEPYILAGRKVTAPRAKGRVAKATGVTRRDALQTKAIKDWGRRNGFTIAARGRLSQALLDAYEAGH